MEEFTSISLEVKLNGTWTNITSDVMASPGIKGNKGIMGNKPEDRVADLGRLEFELDNSTGNSGGLLGYYSPGHANCRSGWDAGALVRLSFSYKGFTRTKFYGRIEPDGITVVPGLKGPRRVQVKCYDYFGVLAFQKINLLEPQAANPSAIPATDAIADLLANLSVQPLETSYSGSASMVYVFDNLGTDQSALSELNKLAVSNRNYIVNNDGHYGELFSVIESVSNQAIPNITSTSFLLLENGDNLLLESGDEFLLDETENLAFDDGDLGADTSISYGKDVINYLTMVTYPREIDASATTVLWNLQNTEDIAAGQSITIRGTYRDPDGGNTKINATEWVTPVATTDYKANASADGLGADRTANLAVTADFGAAEVELTLTNSHAATIYTGGNTAGTLLQVRGKAIRLYDPSKVIAQDATSIATHGKRPATVDMRYANQAGSKGSAANTYISLFKDPQYEVDRLDLFANRDEKNMYAFMFADIRTQIEVTETMTGLSGDAFVLQGYDFEVLPNSIVRWYPIYKGNL